MKTKLKRLLSILFILLLLQSLNAQNDSLIIQGHLSGHDTISKITLWVNYGNILQRQESFDLTNGKFRISFQLSETPTRIRLIESQTRNKLTFYTDNRTLEVFGTLTDFENASIKNNPYFESEKAFHSEFSKDSSYEHQLSIITKYLNSPSAIHKLSRLKRNFPIQKVKQLYTKLDKEWKDHDYGITLKNYFSVYTTPAVNIGDTIINIIGKNQKGNPFDLKQSLSDKMTLLEFGSYACPWSRRSIKVMDKVNSKYADKVQIITFVHDTREKFWELHNQKWEVDWTKIWDGFGQIGKSYIAYGVKGTPKYFLINSQGIVLDKWSGLEKYELVEERINKLLSK